MLIVQAIKCPDTGKLFETEAEYLRHRAEVHRENERKQREKDRRANKRALAKEFASLPDFNQMAEWLIKNFVRVRKAVVSAQETGSLARIEFRGMRYCTIEDFGYPAGWSGDWSLFFKTPTSFPLICMLPQLGVRLGLSPRKWQFDPEGSETINLAFPARIFQAMLREDISVAVSDFEKLARKHLRERLFEGDARISEMLLARTKNASLASPRSHPLLLKGADEITAAARLFPEFDTYFSLAVPREPVRELVHQGRAFRVQSQRNRQQYHYLVSADDGVHLRLSDGIPANAPLLSVNDRETGVDDDTPF